jgi:hypothetical protein
VTCTVCQQEVHQSDSFCGSCGASLLSDGGMGGSTTTAVIGGAARAGRVGEASAATRTVDTLPGTPLLLGDGEVVWRQYRVSQLHRRDQGEGTLYVTDARVVFYARAKGRGTRRASELVQQTKVGEVTGLTAYVSRRLSIGWLLTTALFVLLLLVALLGRSWRGILLFALLTAGAIAMLVRGVAKRGSVGVRIHSGATQASPIGFGQFEEQHGVVGQLLNSIAQPFLALLGVYTAFDVLVGFPGQDAEQVIAELGALIFDLQSRGSLAGTHWGVATG